MRQKIIKTLFLGTSDFAVPIFEKLLDLDYIDVVGIVTQPDKSVGRKQVITASPVKQLSIVNCQLSIVKIYQPEKLKLEASRILEETKPELIVVASYGQFVPKEMLDYPKFKCLNIHVSLLPDLRGAVPIPMAILKGYKETGVSIQVMEEGMDTGDIISNFPACSRPSNFCKGNNLWRTGRQFPISNSDTTASLTKKASEAGAELLEKVLPDWIAGKITSVPQDDSKATYCYQRDISKDKAEIDFAKTSREIDQMVRAFFPWPIAWFALSKINTHNEKFWGKRVKIYTAKILDESLLGQFNIHPGQFFKQNKMLCVRTGDGALQLDEIQIEGKSKMSGKEGLFLV